MCIYQALQQYFYKDLQRVFYRLISMKCLTTTFALFEWQLTFLLHEN